MYAFDEAGLKFYYTKLSGVKGRGEQGEKQMDGVWPEENFFLFTYVEEALASQIAEIAWDVKCLFPREGLNVFQVQAVDMPEPVRVREAQRQSKLSLLEQEAERGAELDGKTAVKPTPGKRKKKKEEVTLSQTAITEGPLF